MRKHLVVVIISSFHSSGLANGYKFRRANKWVHNFQSLLHQMWKSQSFNNVLLSGLAWLIKFLKFQILPTLSGYSSSSSLPDSSSSLSLSLSSCTVILISGALAVDFFSASVVTMPIGVWKNRKINRIFAKRKECKREMRGDQVLIKRK